MTEPIGSIESEELPHTLRAAFAELGREAPSAETVARVQRALSALADPSPASTVLRGLPVGKQLVFAALIALGMGALLVRGRRHEQPAAREVAPASEQRPVAASTPVQSVRVLERAPTLPASVLAAPRPPVKKRAAQRAVSARARSATPAPVETSAAMTAEANVETRTEELAPPLPEPLSHVDEAQRLAECRRLAVREPERALQELEALAHAVPFGTFVQEREVLEIRLQAQLGHASVSAELSRRFLERHPSSIYRRMLTP